MHNFEHLVNLIYCVHFALNAIKVAGFDFYQDSRQ
jgi:hypothetical protein